MWEAGHADLTEWSPLPCLLLPFNCLPFSYASDCLPFSHTSVYLFLISLTVLYLSYTLNVYINFYTLTVNLSLIILTGFLFLIYLTVYLWLFIKLLWYACLTEDIDVVVYASWCATNDIRTQRQCWVVFDTHFVMDNRQWCVLVWTGLMRRIGWKLVNYEWS